MTEETIQTEKQAIKKERFEFVFTVNGNIICQRYFRINGFKQKSLSSKELTDTFNYCVDLIKNDLIRKSNVFLWHTAPQVYNNKEEMDNARHDWLEVPTYVILRDSDEVYLWNGKEMELYNGYFNKTDYIPDTANETPCVLKLTFMDYGREVISKCWDGNVYPRFVRTNIDLSNSKNKYESGANFSPFESALIKLMIDGQPDLIPQIVKELCICCSYENDSDYTTSVKYGDKTYSLNPQEDWWRYVNSLEARLRKKTEKYQNTLY